jgi:integrase/recombinase XerD
VTHLRRKMLEELERRNYSESTTRRYLRYVERFAQHFGRSPDKLSPDHLRTYQSYLLKVRKLDPGTVECHVSALRFLFIRTLHRHEFRQFLPYPKVRRKLPKILSLEEVARLIDASSGLFERTLLMVLYGTGMRRAEIARLKIDDIDSQRMVIHVVNGKGGKDRDLPLSPKSLETLRAYWRWLKPETYLFPSRTLRDSEQPITDKTVWRICSEAARRAGISRTSCPCSRRALPRKCDLRRLPCRSGTHEGSI